MPTGTLVNIYAIRCESFIKVGIAADVAGRVSDLQVATPFELRAVFRRQVRHEVADVAEMIAHQRLAHCRHRGEWFRCTVGDAKGAIISAVAQAERQWLPPEQPTLADRQALDAIRRADDLLMEFDPSVRHRPWRLPR